MDLTGKQEGYIYKHLRNPSKSFSIAAIAKRLAQNNLDVHLDSEEVEITALLMNIGETSENMKIDGVSIYSKEYGPWDDKAKTLNENRGAESVNMAESQGIHLSDIAKEAIISTSRGGTLNKMGITLKIAQTMEAIKYPRYSRGEIKEPAQDISEVTQILNEELSFMLKGQELSEDIKKQIQESMISAARTTYVERKKISVRNLIETLVVQVEQDAKARGKKGYTTILDGIEVEEIIESLTEQDIDQFCSKVERITSEEHYTPMRKEDSIDTLIKNWEIRKKDISNKAPQDII